MARKIAPLGDENFDDLEDVETGPDSKSATAKERILMDIDEKISDIREYEEHSSWRQFYFGYCFLSLLVGILLVLYGLGVTELFRSNAPSGGAMFAVLGIGGCCFFPFFLWTCIRCCPFRSYAAKKEKLKVKMNERRAVEEKRLRYLYSMDEEVPVVKLEKKMTAQMKLALINAQFNEGNEKSEPLSHDKK